MTLMTDWSDYLVILLCLIILVAAYLAGIKERKRVKRALWESERRFRMMADAAPSMMWVVGSDGSPEYFNRRVVEYVGSTLDNQLAGGWQNNVHPDDKDICMESYHNSLRHHVPFRVETRVQRHDGEYRWMITEGVPRYSTDGQFIGLVGTCLDIHDLKMSEQALRQSESSFRWLFESNLLAIAFWDIRGNLYEANDAYFSLSGYTREDLEQGKIHWFNMVPEEWRPLSIEGMTRAALGENILPHEFQIIRKNGTLADILVAYTMLEGSKEKGLVFLIDLTEQKQAENALKESQARFKRLSDSNLLAIAFWDINGNVYEANDAYLNLTGYTREELSHGKIFWTDIASTEAHPIPIELKRMLAGEYIPPYEDCYQRKDGKPVNVLVGYTLLEGSREKGIAFMLDITERKKALLALVESEQRFRLMADTVPALIWMVNAKGEHTYFNRQWFEFTGQVAEQTDWLSVIHADERDDCDHKFRRAFEKQESFEMEYRLQRADGNYRWMIDRGVPRFAPGGEFLGYIGSILDVTERRDARAELERLVADRTVQLQAVNQELESFSYAVSHDLRAPLRTIDGFSQAILELYANRLDDRGRDYLTRIRQGSQQMGQLIDDMLKLSRLTRSEMNLDAQVDLSQMASEIAEKLHAEDPGRQVKFDIEPGLHGQGDPHLLRIALENLIGNAWKYTSKRPVAHIKIGRIENGITTFYVQDDGAGFDMAYADKLFGAFQRLHTTQEFPGTGVGLATVARIIHRHGGEVWADGEVDRGATFYFTLKPVSVKEPQHVFRAQSAYSAN